MIDIKVGDKVKAKKVDEFFGKYINDGDVFVVSSVDEDDWVNLQPIEDEENSYIYVSKQYGMSLSVLDKCFDKYEETKPDNNLETKVSPIRINWIIDNSYIEVSTIFDKCTVVTCKLPNGFIIVESSACVDPNNYDEAIGFDICMKRIKDKVWELEGYMLQDKVYNANLSDNVNKYCDGTCCGCSGESDAINWLI